jgi:hypothetical protein
MKSIDGRLNKLEDRLGITRVAARYLLLVMDAGGELGPAADAYLKSVEESGVLPAGGFGVVDLSKVLDTNEVRHAGLNPTPEVTIELV